MDKQPKRRRCPQCGQGDALVVNFQYWQPRSGERKLIDADVRCTKCTFAKQLVGTALHTAIF